MRVILNRDVPNLGEEGDVRDVAPGYARNYLMPKGLVIAYNQQNLTEIEKRREVIEQRKAEKRTAAMSTKERLESQELVIEVSAGQNGRLFGSVTTANIVEALAKEGLEVERKRVDIPDGTIKSVGVHPVRVKLYEDQEATIKVRVKPQGEAEVPADAPERAPEEAPAQAAEPENTTGAPEQTEATATDAPTEEEETE
ncbi:MAG: 50S ribosomal protein L9 [Spirochaetaceae bacterium]